MALIGTLTSGISALKSFSKGLETIGNNISNVNTSGFKSSSASFSDMFRFTLRSGGTTDQIGAGVQVAAVSTNYAQGSLSSTGKGSDLGVSGNGYFVVQDAIGANFVTRDGAFNWDNTGNLVNAQGYRVLDDAGVPIKIAAYATATSVSIGTDGTVTAFAADGTFTSTQKVGLLRINDETKLSRNGNNLYDFSRSGTLVTSIGTPKGGSLGSIQAGTLELSNVDLTEQFSALINTQRSFQASSRLITVSDTVLEDIVNLKR
jgi:flagellar hook protein FlgE